MEILFELLSNPIALFILIGVISSLFNQKKGEGKQPQRRPVRPPGPMQPPGPARQPSAKPARRQPAETRIEPRPEIEKDVRRESEKHVPDDTGVEIINDLQKVYQERKLQSAEQVNKERSSKGRMSAGDSSGRLNQKREQKKPEIIIQPDRDTLVEGIIWAEVLGQPRAKRPYNPVRRN